MGTNLLLDNKLETHMAMFHLIKVKGIPGTPRVGLKSFPVENSALSLDMGYNTTIHKFIFLFFLKEKSIYFRGRTRAIARLSPCLDAPVIFSTWNMPRGHAGLGNLHTTLTTLENKKRSK